MINITLVANINTTLPYTIRYTLKTMMKHLIVEQVYA